MAQARSPRTSTNTGAPAAEPRTTTVVKLPAVSITVSRTGPDTAAATSSRLRKIAVYGGIAALGALEVVEWPVAVGLGAGTYAWRRITGRTGRPGARTAGGAGSDDTTP